MSLSTTPAPDDLRYPLGHSAKPVPPFSEEQRVVALAELAKTPSGFAAAVAGLSDAQLDTPYREGGWTVRQLVHHVADSHANAFIRTRLALTQDEPTINAYDEKLWALLPDAAAPVTPSLQMLEGLHERWMLMLRALTPEQWQRAFLHPERGRMTVEGAAQLYAWHSRHHTAHITGLRSRMGW